jgi:hypothetical protein
VVGLNGNTSGHTNRESEDRRDEGVRATNEVKDAASSQGRVRSGRLLGLSRPVAATATRKNARVNPSTQARAGHGIDTGARSLVAQRVDQRRSLWWSSPGRAHALEFLARTTNSAGVFDTEVAALETRMRSSGSTCFVRRV